MKIVPERQVKQKVKGVLDKYRKYVYYYMPVPGGYGKSTLDYLGFCCGRGFAIETKRTGGKPTARQDVIAAQIMVGGAAVFVINSDATLDNLDLWLSTVVERYVCHEKR